MKSAFPLTVLALCSLASAAVAQGAPVAEAFRSTADRAAKNLVAAAEEVPADKYGYKPTPVQMSVGDIVDHLSEGNDFLCAAVSGAAAPKRAALAKDAKKDARVARLRESFDFCHSALAKVTDADLSAQVPFFGNRKVSRAQAMFVTAQDWADHYSQLANYLRLNGLVPPTAKQKQE
jgi:uncharacterized damage-inducible protein DinB